MVHILLKPGLENFEHDFGVDHNKLWKILKEMGIPDHHTCLLRNMYTGQATVRTGQGTTDWFLIGKGVCQGCIFSPCLFNLYAEYIMWNAGLDDARAGIKIAGRNSNNLRYTDDTTIMAEWRGTKELLDESERGEWKIWLKTQHSKNEDHGIQSDHSMANGWRKKMDKVTDFIFLVSKITVDGNCSHEIKRRLLLGRKAMTNLESILKRRAITFPTMVCLVRAMVFPVVVYGCESWTIKKAERWRTWCFWTVVLEKTLESPLDCKEIQPVHPKGDQSWVFIGRTDAEA